MFNFEWTCRLSLIVSHLHPNFRSFLGIIGFTKWLYTNRTTHLIIPFENFPTWWGGPIIWLGKSSFYWVTVIAKYWDRKSLSFQIQWSFAILEKAWHQETPAISKKWRLTSCEMFLNHPFRSAWPWTNATLSSLTFDYFFYPFFTVHNCNHSSILLCLPLNT